MGSHLDEITFMVTKKYIYDSKKARLINPIFCAKPLKRRYSNDKKRILDVYGFRSEGGKRLFKKVGDGYLYMEENGFYSNDTEYYIKSVEAPNFREGDLIVFSNKNLQTKFNNGDGIIFEGKALDDRVGVLSHLYTMRELAKIKIKAKLILVGDEEGVCSDLAWAKLTRPTFKKYCKKNGIIIVCDGINGFSLEEFIYMGNTHVNKAIIPVYLAAGKGSGDPGIFSLMRDKVIPKIKEISSFEGVTTTDYISRSFDPKIMDDFSSIIFIDWSNGPVRDPTAICHYYESVSINQVIHIIGVTFYSYLYFYHYYEEELKDLLSKMNLI